ncbi:hypothetical protein L6164_007304 [Bauhinia variegata]|uniref:Uncharacterized protein n=1 Tax=Bauhinia variegata TaxID=167791 RepID=A0ACB9PC87_BAUVA|nr:hypothetical protein L6164_007304 [Bauhinia variegata]
MGTYELSAFFLCVSLCFCLCPIVLCQLSESQTNTMNRLRDLLNGSVTLNSAPDSNPCTWKGVTCDSSNSSVIKISLSGLSLSSPNFLSLLCQIDTLQHVDVSNNHLSSIPNQFFTDCGKNERLKLLNFSLNSLVGPLPTFQGFHGLESLDMSFNYLSWNIGSQLDELVSLKSLNLCTNHFNGSLPTSLGNSMALEELVLSRNHFEGGIPEKMLTYKNLNVIDLSENNLIGSVPSDIGNLSKLEFFILSSNDFNGEIPKTLGNISTLKRVAAHQNNFIGVIPPGITPFLRSLDLSYNNLSGTIPADLLSSSNLESVDLSYNALSGPLPTNISSSLVRLRLGRNSLNGTIPSATLATLESLTYMELENNRLTGSIPRQLGSCRNLALLDLAQNELSGELPAELGNLANLQVLKLQMNHFSGLIPIQITQLQSLSTLNLSWNYLEGPIPSEISRLEKLTLLNLQGNKLTGSIPTSISSLTYLMEVQLGGNQLSNDIPKMPRTLQIALNLSSNLFKGPIPSSFDNLHSLEVLDLSNNQFSGEIPEFLTKLETLTLLVLSNNQLSGVIPNFHPWVRVVKDGNEDIKNNTPNAYQHSAKKGKSVVVAFLVALAAAVFVIGVAALLVVSISRHYHRINDENSQSGEDLHPPQVVQGNLFTPNGIHRSNIDFSKAIEAAGETSNVTLKTRFSTYYKAIMASGATYFVKKLNCGDKIFPLGSRDKFGKELEILAKLNNSNIMAPLGYVLSTQSAYILYEFVSNGSLYDVLHGSMRNSLDWASRYSIAVGVAQGLSFLHGYASGPLLLLDLSSKSIMLKSLKEPLVGDIELYKVIDLTKSTGSFSAVAGSVGYVTPEYAYTMRVTMAGNVYSFGVILLELLTGKPPVTEGTELVKWVLRYSAKQDHILDFNVSGASQAVRNQMLAVLRIALTCVSTSPDSRPKMKSVLRMLLNAR